MKVFYLCLGDLWERPVVATCAWRPAAGGSVPDTPVFPQFQPPPPPPSSPPCVGGCYSGCWLMWLDPQTCNRDDNSWCWAIACARMCVHECMHVCVCMHECVTECICTLCLCCTLCVSLSVFFRVCTSFNLLRSVTCSNLDVTIRLSETAREKNEWE